MCLYFLIRFAPTQSIAEGSPCTNITFPGLSVFTISISSSLKACDGKRKRLMSHFIISGSEYSDNIILSPIIAFAILYPGVFSSINPTVKIADLYFYCGIYGGEHSRIQNSKCYNRGVFSSINPTVKIADLYFFIQCCARLNEAVLSKTIPLDAS